MNLCSIFSRIAFHHGMLFSLLSILHAQATYIDMTINIQKTVAMVFTPSRRSIIVSHTFPRLKIGDHCIRYVEQFRFSLTDDEDINREIKNMFVRTNILLRKYKFCSVEVRTIGLLFRSFCLCMYDIGMDYGKSITRVR